VARPRSDDKRSAILAAATRVIVSQGLSAPTAVIAREAGVANGSLFTYFETKSELFNSLYVELKREMSYAAIDGLPQEAAPREQLLHMWLSWAKLAVEYPEKRRALAQLDVSDEITPASRMAGHQAMAGVAELLERIRLGGAMRDAPMGLVVAMLNALANATIEFMVSDPKHADVHCSAGFDALWRVIG
jgi:AcrR family transcriptional regulator